MMKKWIVLSFLALPLLATGQETGGFDLSSLDAAKIQTMLEQAEVVQACMAKVDQTQLQNLQADAESKGTEIDALCQEGKHSEAQAQAVTYGQQLINEPLVKEMQDCVGVMDLTLPLALWAQTATDPAADSHVCKLRERALSGAAAAGVQ
jgi:hypothetical protein